MSLDTFTPSTDTNLKWIRACGIKYKHKTIKLLEESIGENLGHLEFDRDLLHTTSKT
jgi:hypothetical protein